MALYLFGLDVLLGDYMSYVVTNVLHARLST